MNVRIKNADKIGAEFSGMVRSLSRLSGFSEERVTKESAGRVLKRWAGYTKVAKTPIIDRNARLRALRELGFTKANPISINVGIRGQRGRVWFKTPRGKYQLAGKVQSGGTFMANGYHFRNGDWIDINEAVQDSELAFNREFEAGLRAAGVARQSVVQMADQAGIRLEEVKGSGASPAAISKARRAIPSSGRFYQNGTATESSSDQGKYSVMMTNSLPYLYRAGMDVGLARAMQGEIGYFRTNMQKGVFNSMQTTARAYPWMRAELSAA